MKERSLNRFLKHMKFSLMQRKGNYMTKGENRQLKRMEQVAVLEEEGCREKGEVKMLYISSQ
uniref:Uncharacterized protein n=1 Tax=Mandrillus leucophaeus TaxID=9568 RepID=A0A2K5XXF2_MANLE